MHTSARSLHLLLAATVLTSCGGGARSTNATNPRRDPDLITAEELATTTSSTLYDAVRALRPAWMLRTRPTALMQQNQSQVIVYVDGTRFGNLESLRQITPQSAASVRFHSPGSAEARFGPGHLLGAIEVTTLGR
jgi:hypothetical protein